MRLNVLTLTRHEFGRHFDLVTGMHRLRARVFKDRLDWDVIVSGDQEIDIYDAEEATYLLVVSECREVVGHVRLLPTTGPNMLADTFPMLLGNVVAPASPRIVESSRFCVDQERASELAEGGLKRATFMLFGAMLEWSLDHRQAAIATVTGVRMDRILRRAGWPLQRLGEPQLIGSTQALAGLLPVSVEALACVREAGGLDAPVGATRTGRSSSSRCAWRSPRRRCGASWLAFTRARRARKRGTSPGS